MKYDVLSLREYVRALGAGTAVPGGGSAAALSGALAGALSAMVANLTLSREKYEDAWEEMERIGRMADEVANRCLDLACEDSEAYQGVLAAYRLPKGTEEEKETRRTAVRESMKKAADVPLETLRAAEKIMELAHAALKKGNPNCLTDAWAAVHLARAAAAVAAANVRINLPGTGDEDLTLRYGREVRECLERIESRFEAAVKDFEAAMP
jgi:methenyltetrahydrofolate cyclohydrolase